MSPRKKTSDLLFYALLYLVLFFAAAVASSQIIFRGEFVTLPDLSGKTVEEARAALAPKRITPSIQAYRFDARVEKGRIIQQDPARGSRIKPRRSVKIVVSEGNEQVAVPKLEGRSLEAAAQSLKAGGLRRGRVSQFHTDRVAAGRIIAQSPAAEARVGRNSAVDFLVGQGARETRYVMPDLIEKNAQKVTGTLTVLGFIVDDVHYSYYPGLEPGVVLRQSPVHGSRIQTNTRIALEVSK
jgi:serine/threonine-protein kinase